MKLLQQITELWQFQALRGKKWEAEKTTVSLLRISKIWWTLLVYNDSKCNFLRCANMYSKCVLLNNILKFTFMPKVNIIILVIYLKMLGMPAIWVRSPHWACYILGVKTWLSKLEIVNLCVFRIRH